MKLSDEQLKLYEALTPLQKKCVDIKIKNPILSNAEIYIRAKMMNDDGSINRDDGSINKNDARRYGFMRLNHPNVKAFLKSIEVETIDDMIASREEILTDLTNMINVTIEDVMQAIHADDYMMNVDTGEIYTGMETITVKRFSDIPEYARKAIKKIKKTRYGIEVELVDPIAARKLIVDMQGFNAPTKQEITLEGPTTLSDFYGNTESES